MYLDLLFQTPEEDDTMMVDCMCVWLYATLGYKVLEKATTLLASMKKSIVTHYFSMECEGKCYPLMFVCSQV